MPPELGRERKDIAHELCSILSFHNMPPSALKSLTTCALPQKSTPPKRPSAKWVDSTFPSGLLVSKFLGWDAEGTKGLTNCISVSFLLNVTLRTGCRRGVLMPFWQKHIACGSLSLSCCKRRKSWTVKDQEECPVLVTPWKRRPPVPRCLRGILCLGLQRGIA